MVMSYFEEFLQLIAQMRDTFRYDFSIANFYGIADFRRNEFVTVSYTHLTLPTKA